MMATQFIEQIRSLEASVDVFDAEIARLLSGFDTQLTAITGIGPTLAAVILSEIGGDIRRFSSPAKLAAYADVDPTVKQSGDFSGSRMKMSKRGSPCLRRAIWLASTVAAFKDPAIHALYERKRAEGKDHMTVIRHVCRKMISIFPLTTDIVRDFVANHRAIFSAMIERNHQRSARPGRPHGIWMIGFTVPRRRTHVNLCRISQETQKNHPRMSKKTAIYDVK